MGVLFSPRRVAFKPSVFRGVNWGSPQAAGLLLWWPMQPGRPANNASSSDVNDLNVALSPLPGKSANVTGDSAGFDSVTTPIDGVHGGVMDSGAGGGTHGNRGRMILRDTTNGIGLGSVDLAYSIAAWLNLGTVTATRDIISMGNFNDASLNSQRGVGLDGSSQFAFIRRSVAAASSAVVATTGRWYHVVVTTNGSNSHEVFVDGVSSGTSTTSMSETDTIDQFYCTGGFDFNAYFGSSEALPNVRFSDVRFYRGRLDLARVQHMFDPATRFDLWASPRNRVWVPAGAAVANTKTLLATQAQAALLVKQTRTTKLATEAASATVLKQVNRSLFSTQAQAARLTVTRVILKSLLAVQAQAALLVKQTQALRVAAQAQQAALTKRVSTTLFALEAAAATVLKQVNKKVIATQAQTAVLTVTRVILKTLIATQAQASVLVRQAGKLLAPVQAQVSLLVKQVQALRPAGQAQQATTTKRISVTQVATQSAQASLSKLIAKLLTAVENAVALLKTVLPGAATPRAMNFLCAYTPAQNLAAGFGTAISLGASAS